jgi:hypothetical protein
VHTVDFETLGVVVDLDFLVAAPAAEQVSRHDPSCPAPLRGAMRHADGASPFRARQGRALLKLQWWSHHPPGFSGGHCRPSISIRVFAAKTAVAHRVTRPTMS